MLLIRARESQFLLLPHKRHINVCLRPRIGTTLHVVVRRECCTGDMRFVMMREDLCKCCMYLCKMPFVVEIRSEMRSDFASITLQDRIRGMLGSVSRVSEVVNG